MNLFGWTPSVDIFYILPGFLWQPLLTRSVASLKLKLSSGYKAVDCSRTNKNAEWRSGESTRLPAHQCGLGSNPGVTPYMYVGWVCGSRPCSERVFFVYFGFPSPQKYTLPNSIPIWNARTLFEDFLRTPKCSVGKEMSSYNFYRCLICTRARPCTRAPAPSPNSSVGTWKNGCVHIATTFLAPSPIP